MPHKTFFARLLCIYVCACEAVSPSQTRMKNVCLIIRCFCASSLFVGCINKNRSIEIKRRLNTKLHKHHWRKKGGMKILLMERDVNMRLLQYGCDAHQIFDHPNATESHLRKFGIIL